MFSLRSFSFVSVFAFSSLLAACSSSDDTSGGSPDTSSDELDAKAIAELEQLADNAVAAGIPGISVAVVRGKQQVTIARGVSDRATGNAISPEHRLRVASVAKTVVASVVLQLVRENELQLQDTLGALLPGTLPAHQQVTVEQMLRLESGIPDFSADERYLAPYLQGDFEHRYSPEQLVALAADHPPMFEPGERFAYSNTNYVLLGLIVEKLTGKPLSQVVEQRVTEPLGLSASTMENGSDMPEPFAHGYLVGMGDPLDVTAISASSVFGCGNFVSTPLDLAKLYGALVQGKIVDDAQLPGMFTIDPAVTNSRYGMGVFRFENDFYPCGDFVGHDGGIPGYDTSAYSSVDGKRQFAVVATSMTVEEAAGDAAAQKAWKEIVVAAACK